MFTDKDHEFYIAMCESLRALIFRLGEFRCKGHGQFAYMVMRVMADVLPDYVVLTKQELESAIAERNLFSLREESMAESMAGSK
jgi:hypothetical protein